MFNYDSVLEAEMEARDEAYSAELDNYDAAAEMEAEEESERDAMRYAEERAERGSWFGYGD